VVSDGQKMRQHKGAGLVDNVFNKSILKKLKGNIGIRHIRYSTTGASKIQNVQPIVVECAEGI
jgi:amidophosphoribosyltransferase